jgi:hypothetical protein
MFVVLEEYAKGGRSAYEMSNDGLKYLGEWAGPVRIGERTSSFVAIACDSNPKAVDRLLESMTWLTEQLENRKERLKKEK